MFFHSWSDVTHMVVAAVAVTRGVTIGEGAAALADVRPVVLENDGDWSVIPRAESAGDESAFLGLPIPGRPANSRSPRGHEAAPATPDRLP